MFYGQANNFQTKTTSFIYQLEKQTETIYQYTDECSLTTRISIYGEGSVY